MKILNIVFNMAEFIFAVLGFWLVIMCLAAYFTDEGCLKINDWKSTGCVEQRTEK